MEIKHFDQVLQHLLAIARKFKQFELQSKPQGHRLERVRKSMTYAQNAAISDNRCYLLL